VDESFATPDFYHVLNDGPINPRTNEPRHSHHIHEANDSGMPGKMIRMITCGGSVADNAAKLSARGVCSDRIIVNGKLLSDDDTAR